MSLLPTTPVEITLENAGVVSNFLDLKVYCLDQILGASRDDVYSVTRNSEGAVLASVRIGGINHGGFRVDYLVAYVVDSVTTRMWYIYYYSGVYYLNCFVKSGDTFKQTTITPNYGLQVDDDIVGMGVHNNKILLLRSGGTLKGYTFVESSSTLSATSSLDRDLNSLLGASGTVTGYSLFDTYEMITTTQGLTVRRLNTDLVSYSSTDVLFSFDSVDWFVRSGRASTTLFSFGDSFGVAYVPAAARGNLKLYDSSKSLQTFAFQRAAFDSEDGASEDGLSFFSLSAAGSAPVSGTKTLMYNFVGDGVTRTFGGRFISQLADPVRVYLNDVLDSHPDHTVDLLNHTVTFQGALAQGVVLRIETDLPIYDRLSGKYKLQVRRVGVLSEKERYVYDANRVITQIFPGRRLLSVETSVSNFPIDVLRNTGGIQFTYFQSVYRLHGYDLNDKTDKLILKFEF